ncbi:ABC transporter substrate-binding protein [Fusobacterium simiae]|uniref:ABC transporter substrate-binding protein n=1 Tax=Fusobacterium simiae TaxID=855 RepID=A0ABT4DM16_FUSSI|nr:ABC transporter substrate-binding protein [Fusobacterium simiae]MCY7009018.1 ABC transporter substrate-binding protein [Fusobacterium simiae]
MKKKFWLIMAMVFSVLFLVACGGDPDKKSDVGSGEKRDTLVIAQGADAKSLDPHASNDNPSSRVRRQIFDSLMELDDEGVPQPMLAESVEKPDDTTIIFHLRKGVKFHNGDEMKASDVKFSLERALKSPEVSHILAGINGVEVLDDYTVKVTTEKPMAAILNNISHPTIAILSEKATNEAGDTFGQNPIGTGPYKFVSWQSGDRITLEAFPDYWQGETPVKNLVFRNIVEETNRTIGLETGELDIIYDIQGMDKTKLQSDDRFNFIEGPQVSITYLGFNMKKAPYDNPKVREAISYAIDQKPIIDTVFLGAGEAANSIIGPNVWGYYDVEKFTQDIEKAKALLAEAGYPNGFKAKIWVNDNPVRRDTAVILQDQLKQIGIDLAIETVEWGAFLDGTARGDHEMYLLGWGTVTRDPDYGMYELTSSSTMGAAGNRSFYSNPEVDKLLEAGKTELDPEKRKDIYKQIQEIVRKDIPMYMIVYPLQNVVTKKDVKNFKLDAAQAHKLYGVSIGE